MNLIPTPKSLRITGGTIPSLTAKSFCGEAFDREFDGAVRAYLHYIRHRSAPRGTTVTLNRAPMAPEAYTLSVSPDGVVLEAGDNAGMNRAFATLIQLEEQKGDIRVLPCCEIKDEGGCNWRGLSLDLSRCWHEPEYLFAAADLCWLYKGNRLQLHLSDDQGVRFPFQAFPKAVAEEHYTEEELKQLIAYCNNRGILVVPEIDAPGHAKAFTQAYPEIFGIHQHLMCAEEKTFDALKTVYGEIAELFSTSPYIHVGGDEASIRHWAECPDCEAYREAHGLADRHQLYGHYIQRLCAIIKDLGRTPLVWEGFAKECNGMIPKDVVVIAWESYYQLPPDILAGGFPVINASWKPLYVVPRKKMWDPDVILGWEPNRWENFWEMSIASKAPIITEPSKAIQGGQMCSWGDHMQPGNAFAPRHDMIREEFSDLRMRFPAFAEKAWNPYTYPDKGRFAAIFRRTDRRLDELL